MPDEDKPLFKYRPSSGEIEFHKPVTPRPDENTWLFRQQVMLDEGVEKMSRTCGGGRYGWCQYIVHEDQLGDYPASTLCCARICRAMLYVFIIFCCVGLVTGWFMEGSMTMGEEINTMNKMSLPNIALCPQPWGSKFAGGKVTVESAEMIELPGGNTLGRAEYTEQACPPSRGRMDTCSCVQLSDNIVQPHGKRGELDYFDYITIKISGENDSPAHQWALGFYSVGVVPQQWSYVTEGHVVEGDVRREEVATGKTEFSDGESVPRYVFRVTGDAISDDGTTTLTFGYDKYLSYVIASFSNKFSFFALMTLMITFFAALNNFGLFELVFPEKQESAELEPNVCFRFVCFLCLCCHPRQDKEDAE